ncbi:unnamed protein product [Cuscuta campestris]|uniref:Reverse transcriptase zinc-binding domain-containing protein n=1 Tax=Cuscuta campestris TaxID=132261 RepID=A0A484KVA0_9ASTE|nr:unnamed protein product [Cuscuta campestris]
MNSGILPAVMSYIRGLDLINLAFAYDLIVACKDEMWSIKTILKCLDHFKRVNGLEDIQPKAGMCYYLRKLLHNRKLFASMKLKGEYETQLDSEWLMGEPTAYPEYPIVWNKLTVPKHQFLLWLGWRNRISTKVRLRRFLHIDTRCVLCSRGEEDKEHLFYGCPYALNIKEEIGQWLGIQWKAKNDATMKEVLEHIRGRRKRQIVIAGFAAVCYAVWRARNLRIKQEKVLTVEESIE